MTSEIHAFSVMSIVSQIDYSPAGRKRQGDKDRDNDCFVHV